VFGRDVVPGNRTGRMRVEPRNNNADGRFQTDRQIITRARVQNRGVFTRGGAERASEISGTVFRQINMLILSTVCRFPEYCFLIARYRRL